MPRPVSRDDLHAGNSQPVFVIRVFGINHLTTEFREALLGVYARKILPVDPGQVLGAALELRNQHLSGARQRLPGNVFGWIAGSVIPEPGEIIVATDVIAGSCMPRFASEFGVSVSGRFRVNQLCKLHIDPRPCAKQPEWKPCADLNSGYLEPAATGCCLVQNQRQPRVLRQFIANPGVLIPADQNLPASVGAAILENKAKLHCVAGKYRLCACIVQNDVSEVSMALVNADDTDAGQQKSQREPHIVVVVHRAHQHGEHDQAKNNALTGRQNVYAPAAETDGAGVDSLAATSPLSGAAPQMSACGSPNRFHGTGTDCNTKAATSGCDWLESLRDRNRCDATAANTALISSG